MGGLASRRRTLARRDAGLDELVDREAAFLAELEDRQLLVGEILRTSGDAEVGDGFQGGVQEKVQHGLFATVSDYGIQIVAWSDSVEQDAGLFRTVPVRSPTSTAPLRAGQGDLTACRRVAAATLARCDIALDMTIHSRDFRSLRQWRGSQDQAFEELCYQLRDPTPDGAQLVKTGSPDGGLEWYVTRSNGVQWGWQAKFTFDIGTLLKLMEKSLKTVIEKRPKCRRLTFCIPFDLPDAPGAGKRKSARQKFEDRKDRWRIRIPGADRVYIELWSEGDLLERLVGHPAQRGMEWFFWNKEVFSPDWCAQRIKITVEAAGERYTPELHVDLPVAFALEGLALSEAYWQRFRTLRGAIVKASNGIKVSRYTGLGVTTQLRNLVRSLKEWRRKIFSCMELPKRFDPGALLDLTRICRDGANAALPHDPPRGKQEKITKRQACANERRRRLHHDLGRLFSALRDFEYLLQSSATKAASCGALLLTGKPDRGRHISSVTPPSAPLTRVSRQL